MRYVAKLTTFLKFQNMQFSQLPSPFFTSSEKRKKIAERKNPIKDLDHVVFAMIVLFSLQSHKKKILNRVCYLRKEIGSKIKEY